MPAVEITDGQPTCARRASSGCGPFVFPPSQEVGSAWVSQLVWF